MYVKGTKATLLSTKLYFTQKFFFIMVKGRTYSIMIAPALSFSLKRDFYHALHTLKRRLVNQHREYYRYAITYLDVFLVHW